MDSIRVSEAPDSGSIPDEATKFLFFSYKQRFFMASSLVSLTCTVYHFAPSVSSAIIAIKN